MIAERRGARPKSVNMDAAEAPAVAGPLSIKEFLDVGYLQCADVILARNEWSLSSWIIRQATDSNFAHAAMIFLQPERPYGWRSTYLIESVFAGVDVTDLDDYFTLPRASVAVKRLNRDWFDDALRRRVRSRMLDDIKAEYDFPTMLRLGRQALFGVQRMLLGHKRAVLRRHAKGLDAPKEFICSGFIQSGYVRAFTQLVGEGRVPASGFGDVIFDAEIRKRLRLDDSGRAEADRAQEVQRLVGQVQSELLAVTPRDIELHEAFDWVYVLTGGKAYPVHGGYAEVCELLQCRPVNR
ncbi:MAG: hypothetical protein ACKVP7_28745 [Hyphomicrobiaceae bacterium]